VKRFPLKAEVNVARRALFTFPALIALLLPLSACGDDQGTHGDLGNGAFSYICISDRDPVCIRDAPSDGTLKAMPNTIAVGAKFNVVFTAMSSAALDGSALVQPVSPEFIAWASGDSAYEAIRPGVAGIVAMRGSSVVDVAHVRLVPVDRVRIDAVHDGTQSVLTGISSLDVPLAGTVTLSGAAVDKAGELLAGSLAVTWTSDDSAIAEITSTPTTDEVQVQGKTAGQTKLHVTVGGVSAEITIAVVGASAKSAESAGAGDAP
jgi:hypothetical protein